MVFRKLVTPIRNRSIADNYAFMGNFYMQIYAECMNDETTVRGLTMPGFIWLQSFSVAEIVK